MNQSFVVAHEALRQNQDLPPPRESERDRLILEHLEQVHLIARRIHERLPQSVNLDDMVSAGILGLIAAVDQYDSTQGVKLSTYAEYKIKGAVLDSLRGMDWAPRKQRKRAREIEAAVAALEQDLQRAPLEEEVADRLGVSVPEYQVVALRMLRTDDGKSGCSTEGRHARKAAAVGIAQMSQLYRRRKLRNGRNWSSN